MNPPNNSTFAFHFSNGYLAYDLGHIKVEEGLVLELPTNLNLILCEQGFHASIKPLDALSYAKGFTCSYVKMEQYEEGEDKIVGRRRTHISVTDCQKAIIKFACWCAKRAEKYIYAAAAAHAANAAAHAANAAAHARAAADAAAAAAAHARAAAHAAAYTANAAAYTANAAAYTAADAAADAAAHAAARRKEIELQNKVLLAYLKKAGLKCIN